MADHSRARLFFDQVMGEKENAFLFLASLVDGGEEAAENGWRDYKEAGFLGKTGNEDKEKQSIKTIWSENLSAFANTGGGVLIWGFHTKGKIPDKLSLAPDCEQLAELLRSLINDATDPYVADVEIQAFKDPSDRITGLVLCYIPASTFAPHQAQWGERTYFIRSQDSNQPCPQTLLRNMFFPRLHSRLASNVKMTVQAQASGHILVYLETFILSLGPATAEVAMISVALRELGDRITSYGDHWERISDNLVKCRHPMPPNLVYPHPVKSRGVLLSNGAAIDCQFFAHNTPVHRSTVIFTQDEVLNCLRSNAPLERRGQSDQLYP